MHYTPPKRAAVGTPTQHFEASLHASINLRPLLDLSPLGITLPPHHSWLCAPLESTDLQLRMCSQQCSRIQWESWMTVNLQTTKQIFQASRVILCQEFLSIRN